ncbi:probable rRNA-processing protein EBP2 [Dipodomys spectabilis]|uniref:probable rRNA-processing protein EBP2 n=1 Tax=Dipodomys spectabilis TaxID=105255 RepID=UPI001C53CD16|nr:probable rRNA-processing protein EBP2 [Dipodomys spectabilis]
MDTPPPSGSGSDSEDSVVTDRELQDAFSRGLLKPGLNVMLEGPKKAVNNVNGLKQCLDEFKRDLDWVERLDVTLGPVPEISEPQPTPQQNKDQKKAVNPEDDFQREMSFYRQAQAAVLAVLPRLHQLHIPTKRPTDYFAEMAKTDQHMQKIRQKLQAKQAAMEKSEKAKQLRALRKYGKRVQTQVLQKRQQEKSHMMNAIKKYQKGFSDKLDFLEGDEKPVAQATKATKATKAGAKGQNMKKAGAKGQNMKKGAPVLNDGIKTKSLVWWKEERVPNGILEKATMDVSSFRAKVGSWQGPQKAWERKERIRDLENEQERK